MGQPIKRHNKFIIRKRIKSAKQLGIPKRMLVEKSPELK